MPQQTAGNPISDEVRPVSWSRTFPATRDQVPQARRFLAALLSGSPLAGDAVICLGELAANAVTHSRSARPGGHFGVRVTVSQAPGWLTVAVTDEGGRWAPRPASEDHGRGLDIVRALAAAVRISDPHPGADPPARTVTFRMRLA